MLSQPQIFYRFIALGVLLAEIELLGETPMNLKVVSLTASAVAAFTMPALAHHSFSMFDAQQTSITLDECHARQRNDRIERIRPQIGSHTSSDTAGVWAELSSGPTRLAGSMSLPTLRSLSVRD